MIRTALVGLGKMGLSHLAIANSHPEIELAVVCDANRYLTDALGRYTRFKVYNDYRKMLDQEKLDAIIVATPSRMHSEIVREAINRDLHIFCEKPFCLGGSEGAELVRFAESRSIVGQVGYHYRFAGTFQCMRDTLRAGILGEVHHIRAEAHGPVVLRPRGSTWRSSKKDGGGCLYDYACHAVNLLQYMAGPVRAVSGTILNSVFSDGVEDEAYSTLHFESGASGQIAANWSDESQRKMSVKVTAWGSNGRISADRYELQAYIRDHLVDSEFQKGWNVRYAAQLDTSAGYYLRGEEYSNQIDHFISTIKDKRLVNISPFHSAAETDATLDAMIEDSRVSGPIAVGCLHRDSFNRKGQGVRSIFGRLKR